MKKNYPLIILCLCATMLGCKESPKTVKTPKVMFVANGADVSWLTEMEAANVKFYDIYGIERECMSLLKDEGVNSIRLRVWVNPTNGWCDKNDLLVKAKRASDLGHKIMVNFHYSDTWADPASQTKPTAWKNYSYTRLKTSVADHTEEVLTLLKTNNIYPQWVQIGNETGAGMLWPDGKYDNLRNYAELHMAGYDAAKKVFPDTKVIVHLQNGQNNVLHNWFFEELKKNGAKWDMIGMSLYPPVNEWQKYIENSLDNMASLIQKFKLPVMICEFGMPWNNPQTALMAMHQLITEAKKLELFGGLFYWEPQAYNDWENYTMGAFDKTGKPTIVLDAFK